MDNLILERNEEIDEIKYQLN